MAKEKTFGVVEVNLVVDIDLGATLDVFAALEFAKELIEHAREQGGVSGTIKLPATEVQII